MWQQAADAFEQAARINRDHPRRRGNILRLPAGAQLLLTGDMHGHGSNLLRVERLAGDLDVKPHRHVVLQELIHQIPDREGDFHPDGSHHVLARVARWQIRFPDQIHVVLGNHEMAQMTGQDILKFGTGICKAFLDAVASRYGDHADQVVEAILDYFRSLPLAVVSADGVAMLHSLPADRMIDRFDPTVFDRPLVEADFQRSGSAYQLLWGRTFGRPSIEAVKSKLDARVLVLGHQPQPTGYLVVDDDVIILSSDHDLGVALQVEPGAPPTANEMAAAVVPLASVAL